MSEMGVGHICLGDDHDPKHVWYVSYYDPSDLHYLERTLLAGEKKHE